MKKNIRWINCLLSDFYWLFWASWLTLKPLFVCLISFNSVWIIEGFYSYFQQEPTRRHTSLVVSPLKSLIRDQITELRKHNIMAYGILEGMEKEEIDGMFFQFLFVWWFCIFVCNLLRDWSLFISRGWGCKFRMS